MTGPNTPIDGPSDWVVDDVNGMFENSRVATATEVINYRVQR